MPQRSLHTPLGDLTVSQEQDAIVALDWGWGRDQADTPLLAEAVAQLQDYFDGRRTAFELPLAPLGTPYQQGIWRALQAIAYGETVSYGALAERLGTAARPVGTACGANPIPILIPCHRVIAKSGALVNYSGDGGIETKAALLRLEGAMLAV
ncbi:MAG: methylated-DNA--[protein]-cysteine S-methyltransferase [Rhodothalassiaceae bacterium]